MQSFIEIQMEHAFMLKNGSWQLEDECNAQKVPMSEHPWKWLSERKLTFEFHFKV